MQRVHPKIQDNQTKTTDVFLSGTHLRHSIGSLGSCWASEVRNDVNKIWSPAPVMRGTLLYSTSILLSIISATVIFPIEWQFKIYSA